MAKKAVLKASGKAVKKEAKRPALKVAVLQTKHEGQSERQLLKRRGEIEKGLRAKGYETVPTYHQRTRQRTLASEKYTDPFLYLLSKKVGQLAKGDAVYFCRGCEQSLDGWALLFLAVLYEKRVMFEDEAMAEEFQNIFGGGRKKTCHKK